MVYQKGKRKFENLKIVKRYGLTVCKLLSIYASHQNICSLYPNTTLAEILQTISASILLRNVSVLHNVSLIFLSE